MKLYYAPGACSQAVHIALHEAHRSFELEKVDLKTRRTATGADFTEINPKGYVPVLELGTERLTEAGCVLQYVADLAPESGLAPPWGTWGRIRLQEWLFFVSSEIHKPFGPLFHGASGPEAAAQRAKLAQRFGYIQNQLADRGFLLGETFTVADAYLFVMLTWCDRFGIDLELWPNLADYESRISSRRSVIDAVAAEGLPPRHHFHAA